ncbi:hypothetical protein HPP92_016765 [Vanilla planifolia]|uniref:BHLH domain-containing protein n=1 Tax=Vanilla planifolia TaxID=51239 RepID=A0A835URK7_VANPL|nr:hypothetical protein HPP92_016765 [Vanilla planifolia]
MPPYFKNEPTYPSLTETVKKPEMALEAVAYPQDLLACTLNEFYRLGEGSWSWEMVEEDKGQAFNGNWDSSCSPGLHHGFDNQMNVYSLASPPPKEVPPWRWRSKKEETVASGEASERKKRRRSKTVKNKEQVENQRMTHIAVERNRRKQMNHYLALLRSLMPPSYVQRGDQASIIGGAINFVKELEQLLYSLEVQKQLELTTDTSTTLATLFTFPQYSSNPSGGAKGSPSTVADIEVAMVESHASLKVLSRRRPRQLLKLVTGLQNLRLTTLHLSLTTAEVVVLYSFSLKVEDDCRLNSVEEIASAAHGILEKIQKEFGV